MSNRVVCTGIGISTSIGIGKEKFWNGVVNSQCGVKPLIRLDEKKFSNKHAYEIEDEFDKEHEIGRASAIAIHTVKEAVSDAGLQGICDVAFIVGTGLSDIKGFEDSINSDFFNYESISTNVNSEFGFTGPALTISTGCAAANYAIGYAFDLIKNGSAKFAIAGGSECMGNVMYGILDRVNMSVPTICQPFDAHRKGVLTGEGAGFLVLESLDSAKKRKAHIYGEILGYGLSCDAGHSTAPDKIGVESAMRKALNDAACKPEDIDFIAMHGTGTILNDVTETKAIKEVFGSYSYKLATSSNKAMVGHTGGASGAISAVSTLLAINNEMIPPTINFTEPDEQCDLDYTPNKIRKLNVNKAMINAFGFGGNNCCIILAKY